MDYIDVPAVALGSSNSHEEANGAAIRWELEQVLGFTDMSRSVLRRVVSAIVLADGLDLLHSHLERRWVKDDGSRYTSQAVLIQFNPSILAA